MSYLSDACTALTTTLNRFATLNAYQLAGHVANLDFWLEEVERGFRLIDGYHQRFQRMNDAQRQYAQTHQTVRFPLDSYDSPGETVLPTRRGVPDKELKSLQRELTGAVHRFLDRCLDAELIDEPRLHSALQRLGIVR